MVLGPAGCYALICGCLLHISADTLIFSVDNFYFQQQ